jgi:hypothetical protein
MANNNDVLERKNEVLKKKVESMILRENQFGLSQQDNQLKQQFIKEMHANNYHLK